MILQIVLVVFLPAIISAQSSCAQYWQYVRGSGQIEGLLTLKLDSSYSEHQIKLVLTVGDRLPSSYVGDVSLIKDKETVLKDVSYGQPIQYRVRFPIHNPLPKLTEVVYNNQKLCVNQKDTGSFVTTINLDHKLYSNSRPQNIQVPSRLTEQTNPPVRPTQSPQRISPVINHNECGVPDIKSPGSIGLVVNGNPAKKGQFPWLAAYFHNGDRESAFICGGTLVSARSVITAAHCIHTKYDIRRKEAHEAFFHFGKHMLNSHNEPGYQISGVSQFIMHPEWNAQSPNYDADIAIAHLTRTITFTTFVKPICLWTASNNYRDIVNKNGVVAGYGKTGKTSQTSPIPFWLPLPVVDELTCLRSNSEFSTITSKRTFCIGNRDGKGPCSGDSGGGFVVINNGRWYLRGIVSSSLVDDSGFCDTTNYAVFTDVSAFQGWIQSNLV